jgi:hypothetical protein
MGPTSRRGGPQRVGRGRLTVSRCARRLPGRLVMAAAQPTAQPLAAYGPGFPVAIDRDVGKGGAGGGVKQLARQPNRGEHILCRQAAARSLSEKYV